MPTAHLLTALKAAGATAIASAGGSGRFSPAPEQICAPIQRPIRQRRTGSPRGTWTELRSYRVHAQVLNRSFADDKIFFAFDSEVAEIKESTGRLSGVALRGVFTGATRDLDVISLFIAIGHDPRTELFKAQLAWKTTVTSRSPRPRRGRASRESSPRGTSSTTPTARPSPPPALPARHQRAAVQVAVRTADRALGQRVTPSVASSERSASVASLSPRRRCSMW